MSCSQPLPSAPSSASSGTRTSSRWSSLVSSPPSVLIGVIVMPSASRGHEDHRQVLVALAGSPVRQTISVWLALCA